ncbi:uncharacterized protein LOC135135549 [Zophobas morio]|uniref:uncharacterized protein LOC135135549 n=1 Tax=Zophobas morio TaxID=2755281 RepID=UPI00308321E4
MTLNSETQTPNESYSLSDIRALLPETFSGDRNDLYDFLQNCENAHSLCQSPQQKKLILAFIVSKLRGSARAQIREKEFNTWDELKEVLINAFSDGKDFSQLMEELNTISQLKHESVIKFYTRLDQMQTRILNLISLKHSTHIMGRNETIRDISLQRFVLHTVEEISTALRRSKPKTLSEALTEALLEEKYLLAKRSDNVAKNYHKSCSYCHKTGHFVKDCRQRLKNTSNHVNFNNDQSKSNNFNQSRTNNFNHSKPSKFCNYCKKPGHLIQECRKREYNNRQRNQSNRNISQPQNNAASSSQEVHLNFQRSQVIDRASGSSIKSTYDIQNCINSKNQVSLHPLTNNSSLYSSSNTDTRLQESPIISSRRVIDIQLSKNDNVSYIIIPHEGKQGIVYFKFLIDTGANISLIKTQKLKQTNLTYNPNDTVILNGLSINSPVETLGTVTLIPRINDHELGINFHIVKEDTTNVPFDGLIGNDYLLTQQKANIDFDNLKLTIKDLPFPININCNSNPNDESCYYLSPRSETLIKVGILNKNISEGVTPEIPICEGVFLAKAILKVNTDKTAYTTILNTSDKKIKIDYINLYLEDIPFAKCLSLNTSTEFDNVSTNRLDLLHSNLRLEHLNSEEKESLLSLCQSYNDVFHLPGDSLSHTTTLYHEIKVTDPTPVSSKIYRFPKIHESEVDNQVQKMLQQKIIRPSLSPYNSPLWVIEKKQDSSGKRKWRVVIDYRKLNNVTVGDSYPLPQIDFILDQLGHSKYFTTLDLASGFNQILVHPKDIEKTAFSTPNGHFEYLRMPFGLKNAPATFSRLMNAVLSGLQGTQCFTYMDDVIIYASSLQEHQTKLKNVFDRLRLNNLKLQPDKCEFLHKEISYLGHVITENGVKPNPEKICAISDYPRPTNTKTIKQFLGLLGYYRKFIKNFAAIAKPLTSLLKKDIAFVWGPEQELSFTTFKQVLTNEPILQYPDFSKSFTLTTDSSNFAIGAVLSQGDRDLPVAYTSRTLNKAECNYNTTEKELLAIVYAVKHFRPYLYGQKFKIVTDHRPLTWLFNCRDPSSRLVRWRLLLNEYEYEICYKPGKINSNADALSRNPILTTCDSRPFHPSYDDFVRFHYENQEMITVDSVKENPLDNSPNALLISKDLNEQNLYYETLNKLYDFKSIPPEINIYDVIPLTNANKQKTYLLVTHLNYFDVPSYKELFYSLLNLKKQLLKDNVQKIHFKNPLCYNKKFKSDMINELIHFIFNCTDIKVVLVNNEKITPSKDEIQHILEENHATTASGHNFIHSRKRRGIVNGVSTGLKWLFGIPDADDAEFYSDSIKSLLSQNRDTQLLMQKQIHIISSAITNYNNSVSSFKNYEMRLNENINRFNNFSKVVSKKLNQVTVVEDIITHLNLLTQLITELNEEYDVLISSILFAKQNVLHPSIINPKELQTQLASITLRSSLQFPIPIDDYRSLYKYFSLCQVSVLFDGDNLIFVIQIPLVHEQTFILYKLIPLPIPTVEKNIFSYIDPQNTYLLMSVTKTHYGHLKDISACLKLSESEWMCPQPVIYLTSQRPVCDVRLRTENLNFIPDDCSTKTMKAEVEIWHTLRSNQWLYVLSSVTPATISCDPKDDQIIDINFQGTGIFTLRPKCKCYTMSTSLIASYNVTKNFTNFIPSVDISSDDCCIKEQQILKAVEMKPLELNNLNLDELRHSKHQLDKFEEELRAEINKPFPWGHRTFWGSLIGVITVITVLLIFCCCCCRYCFDCTWLPYIGKLIPKRSNCFIEYCYNSKNHITNSVICVPESRRNNTIDDDDVMLPLKVLSKSSSNETSTLETVEETPAVSNPYNLRSRKSLSRENLSK